MYFLLCIVSPLLRIKALFVPVIEKMEEYNVLI